MLELGEIIRGRVEKIAFGGMGIVRHNGFVLFVPFVAPGDVALFRITKKKKSYAYAELVELEEESLLRKTPRCPWYGKCGGCNMQHIDYGAQLEIKRDCLKEIFRRLDSSLISCFPPIFPAERNWGYRRHVRFHLRFSKGSFRMGFIGADKTSLIELGYCLIFERSDNGLLNRIRKVISKFTVHGEDTASMAALKNGKKPDAYILHFAFHRKIPQNFRFVIEEAMKESSFFTGVLASCHNREVVIGDPHGAFQLPGGIVASSSPLAFLQNHPEQSVRIYEDALETILGAQEKKALDLYCGISCLGLMLANKGLEVYGVESNSHAVAMARKNAEYNAIENIRFVCSDVEKALPELMGGFSSECIVVNPSRAGLSRTVINTLSHYSPKRILYISCMPPTLARDLLFLTSKGYRISQLQSYDMFPQTSHIETFAHLLRVIT